MSSYHGWTHRTKAQGGTDPIPGFGDSAIDWVVLSADEQTIATATLTEIVWTGGLYSIPPDSAAFTVDTSRSTDPLRIELDGWYLFYVNMRWATSTGSDVRLYELKFQSGADNSDPTFNPSLEVSCGFQDGVAITYGPLHLRKFSGTQHVKFRVKHTAGGNRTTPGPILTALYMGTGLGIDDGVTTMPDLEQSI